MADKNNEKYSCSDHSQQNIYLIHATVAENYVYETLPRLRKNDILKAYKIEIPEELQSLDQCKHRAFFTSIREQLFG